MSERYAAYDHDCELDQVAKNRDQVLEDPNARREYDEEMLAFLSGANLLIIDCQYTDEQYANCIGWGHNSLATIVDLCAQVHPDMVALFHHDPQSHDQAVSAMKANVFARLQENNVDETLVFAAREGMQIKVAKPLPPLPL